MSLTQAMQDWENKIGRLRETYELTFILPHIFVIREPLNKLNLGLRKSVISFYIAYNRHVVISETLCIKRGIIEKALERSCLRTECANQK